jgi:hypothetical protein
VLFLGMMTAIDETADERERLCQRIRSDLLALLELLRTALENGEHPLNETVFVFQVFECGKHAISILLVIEGTFVCLPEPVPSGPQLSDEYPKIFCYQFSWPLRRVSRAFTRGPGGVTLMNDGRRRPARTNSRHDRCQSANGARPSCRSVAVNCCRENVVNGADGAGMTCGAA